MARWLDQCVADALCNALVAIPKLKLRGFPSPLVNMPVEAHRLGSLGPTGPPWDGAPTEDAQNLRHAPHTIHGWSKIQIKARYMEPDMIHTQQCNITAVLNRNVINHLKWGVHVD